MKHKHAELIKAWADNTDIRFICVQYGNCDIHDVMNHPDHDWQIVKEPVVEVRYYVKSLAHGFSLIEDEEYFTNWQMKITITDGDIANAKVELR